MVVIGTSISQFLAQDLDTIFDLVNQDDGLDKLLWKVVGLNDAKPLKPVVQVQCNQALPNATKLEFPHSALNTPPFISYDRLGLTGGSLMPNIYTNESWTMDMDNVWNSTLLEEHSTTNSVTFTWVGLQDYTRKPSIAAAVAIPPASMASTINLTTQNMLANMITCSIDARWLPTDLWITEGSTSYYQSLPYPTDLINSLSSSSVRLDKEPIDISLAWASALNIPVAGSSLTTIETILNAAFFYDSLDAPSLVGFALALVLTDGLARVGLNYDAYIDIDGSLRCVSCLGPVDFCDICSEGPFLNPPYLENSSKWDFEVYQYGYGYGITNATSKIAAGVLILYGVIATIAILSIFIRNRNSDSWSSLGELLFLAMNSPQPTEILRNTSAGIGRFKTWKEVVRVRVTEKEQLQMIFEGHEDFDKCYDRTPKVGEKYK